MASATLGSPIAACHAVGGELTRDERRPAFTAILDDFEEVTPVRIRQRRQQPGAEAVSVGLALAERGLRPVPLFNGTTGPSAVVDSLPIIRALIAGAERLQRRQPAPDAAPAFLLDSRRHDPTTGVRPGMYDNRWVTLPQDFPSGALLASRGLLHATLIQRGSPVSTSPPPAPRPGLASSDRPLARESRGYIVSKAGISIHADLAHVLRRWQDHGIALRVIDLTGGQIADNVSVPTPSGFMLARYRLTALLGLRRSHVGGFGSMIPEQIARSGSYG